MQRRQLIKVAVGASLAAFGVQRASALDSFDTVMRDDAEQARESGAQRVLNLEEIVTRFRRGQHGELMEFSLLDGMNPDEFLLQLTVTDIPEYCGLSRYQQYEPLRVKELKNATYSDEGVQGFIDYVEWTMTLGWYNMLDRYQTMN